MRRTLVLLRPVITERSMTETGVGRYTFEVVKSATKQEIGPRWPRPSRSTWST